MYLNKFFIFFLFPVIAFAQTLKHDVEIRVPAESSISGNAVELGAVAQVYVKNIHQFQALSHLELAQFPADQAELVIPGHYIRQRVEELIGKDVSISLEVPEVVHFRRLAESTASEDIASIIQNLGKQRGKFPKDIEVAVEILGALPTFPVNAELEPAIQSADWRGEMNFKTSANEWIKTKIRWFAERWVSRRDVRFQEDLRPDAFVKQRIEVTQLKERGVDVATPELLATVLKNARAKRSIHGQMVLTEEMLDHKPDVRSGQDIRIVFVSPESGLRVETQGQIIQASHIGEEVRARLVKSKKVVSGILTSPSLLEVNL